MKLSFSTLACHEWTMPQIIAIASESGYEGIELRFVENEDSLWKLPPFRGNGLATTKHALSDHGLVISCVDTSCRFHFPSAAERDFWIDEGDRMSDLAASLGAPGIRVFGDQIQAGADRASTRSWIAGSIRTLAEKIASKKVDVWLETHGDFASSSETNAILHEAAASNTGVIWDPANCLLDSGESPRDGAKGLAQSVRHVHLKDMRLSNRNQCKLVLTGHGNFPLQQVRDALSTLNYSGFYSFEWEKKWHPELEEATIALPQFASWMRENWMREN